MFADMGRICLSSASSCPPPRRCSGPHSGYLLNLSLSQFSNLAQISRRPSKNSNEIAESVGLLGSGLRRDDRRGRRPLGKMCAISREDRLRRIWKL